MTTVINYGVGNLFSLVSSLAYIGESAAVSSDPDEIYHAERLILPGVGAFGDAARKLSETGLGESVISSAKRGVPVLGICLGMQLFFDRSLEFGEHRGLSLLGGEVIPIVDACGFEDEKCIKIPQIGWNRLDFVGERNPLFSKTKNGDFVYFVHSYCAVNCEDSLIATTEVTDGHSITAACAKDNIFACQFHPEKSGEVGLNILRAFVSI